MSSEIWHRRVNDPHHEEKCIGDIYSQLWPRSTCAWAQTDQGLRYPLIESLDIAEYQDLQYSPVSTFAALSGSLLFAYIPKIPFLMAGHL